MSWLIGGLYKESLCCAVDLGFGRRSRQSLIVIRAMISSLIVRKMLGKGPEQEQLANGKNLRVRRLALSYNQGSACCVQHGVGCSSGKETVSIPIALRRHNLITKNAILFEVPLIHYSLFLSVNPHLSADTFTS